MAFRAGDQAGVFETFAHPFDHAAVIVARIGKLGALRVDQQAAFGSRSVIGFAIVVGDPFGRVARQIKHAVGTRAIGKAVTGRVELELAKIVGSRFVRRFVSTPTTTEDTTSAEWL